MSFNPNFVLSKPSILLLKWIGTSESEPSSTTLDVDSGGESAGATAITIDAVAVTIPKNVLLEAPTDLLINRTEVDLTSGGDLTVGTLGKSAAEGITTALAGGASITWDGLEVVVGKQSHPFARNANLNTIQGVEYHGAGNDIDVDEYEITSLAPAISVDAVLDWGSDLHKDLEQYSDENTNWYIKQLFIDNQAISATRKGFGRVRGWSEGVSVGDRLSASFVAQFFENPPLTFA